MKSYSADTVLMGVFGYLRLLFLRLKHGNRVVFNPVQSHSIFSGIKLNSGAHLSFGRNTKLSAGCDVFVAGTGKISIGAATYFNKRCMLSCHNSVSVGKECLFGPDVKIYDNNHVFEHGKGVLTGEHKTAPISIGNNFWLASNVVVLKGAKIGDNCIIGAGCLIDAEIPSNSLVTNSQALRIKPLKQAEK